MNIPVVKARIARRVHLALLFLWLGPGMVASWFLRFSLPWLVFLSVYAIVAIHAAGLSAERPSELENDMEEYLRGPFGRAHAKFGDHERRS